MVKITNIWVIYLDHLGGAPLLKDYMDTMHEISEVLKLYHHEIETSQRELTILYYLVGVKSKIDYFLIAIKDWPKTILQVPNLVRFSFFNTLNYAYDQ